MPYVPHMSKDQRQVLTSVILSGGRFLKHFYYIMYVKKPLPKEKITEVLFASRYYLQTAGLICPMEKREELVGIFSKCGLTRITSGSDMSTFFPGESHDGEYALDRYMKVINIEVPDLR